MLYGIFINISQIYSCFIEFLKCSGFIQQPHVHYCHHQGCYINDYICTLKSSGSYTYPDNLCILHSVWYASDNSIDFVVLIEISHVILSYNQMHWWGMFINLWLQIWNFLTKYHLYVLLWTPLYQYVFYVASSILVNYLATEISYEQQNTEQFNGMLFKSIQKSQFTKQLISRCVHS